MKLDTYSTISAQTNAILATGTAQYLWGFKTSYQSAAAYRETDVPCKRLTVQAATRNASTIAVGPTGSVAMSSGWVLSADSITLDIDNINKVQVVGTQNDIVRWLALVR